MSKSLCTLPQYISQPQHHGQPPARENSPWKYKVERSRRISRGGGGSSKLSKLYFMRNSDPVFNMSFLSSFKYPKLIQRFGCGVIQGMIYTEVRGPGLFFLPEIGV